MQSEDSLERRIARGRAVNEAYEGLKAFEVDRRRIVFDVDDHKRSGGYGIVRQAMLYPSSYLPTWWASRQYGPPQHVAVKQIKISEMDNMSDAKRVFTKEMVVWSGLGEHPGVAKFLGFHARFEISEAWLLSPWEPYGNVMDFVRNRELEVPEKLSLVYDTIDALTFLHQLNPPVCHGDIKSANVLINSKYRAVLCDFGLARLYEDIGFERLETSTGFKGSIRWCSPEILDGQPRTPSSDVYAWAWLVWEIMTGELPYAGTLADFSIIRKIFESPRPQVDGESRLGDCLQVWELMTRCWLVDPQQRPTANMCRTTVAYLPRCPPTPENTDRHVRSAALLETMGDLESWKGNYAEGLAHLEQALHIYERDGNERGVVSVLRKQAVVYHRHYDPLKTLRVGLAALEWYKNINDPLGMAEVLFVMGSSIALQSKYDEAMSFLKEALEIFQSNGNNVGVVQCLDRIGEVHRLEYRDPEALSTLESAVEIARGCGDKLGEAKAMLALGTLHIDMGNRENGVAMLSDARDTAQKIGWEHGICTILRRLGLVKYYDGAYGEAEKLCREAASIARRSNARWRLAQTLSDLGDYIRSQGRLEEAAVTLEESYSVYNQISLADSEFADTAFKLAEVKREQGRLEEALLWYDQAFAQYRILRNNFKLLSCLERKGDLLIGLGRYDEAAEHLEAFLASRQSTDYYSLYHLAFSKLCRIPKTAMQWERRKRHKQVPSTSSPLTTTSSLLCDMKRLQRRMPQMTTANLKLPIQPREPGSL